MERTTAPKSKDIKRRHKAYEPEKTCKLHSHTPEDRTRKSQTHSKQATRACEAMQGRAIIENILSSSKRSKSQLTSLSPKFGKNTEYEKKEFD